MTDGQSSEAPSKEEMEAVLRVVEGGNPEQVAREFGMDSQKLLDLKDAFVQRTFQQAVMGEAGKRKISRNEPCPCGSGKKYKKCCLRRHEQVREILRDKKTVDFQPEDAEEGPPEYVVKAFDLLAARNYEEAVAFAEDLLPTHPDDDRLHDTLASAHLACNHYNEAIDICRTRWNVAREEKAVFIEHGQHKRFPQEENAAPPHFYAPETWLEKYWIALKSKEYSSNIPDPQEDGVRRLVDELLTANDLERFPAQQEEGLDQRREALAPTLHELQQVGPVAIPHLLQVMSQFSWAALFIPDLLAYYGTDEAIRSLIDLTMFGYHYVSESCLKHLAALGADVLPYVRDAIEHDSEFDPLRVGLINMLTDVDSPEVDTLLLELLEREEPAVVDWAGLVLGKRKRVDLLPHLEEASSRIGKKPRIGWAINHLQKIKESKE